MKRILFALLLLVPIYTSAQTASFTATADTICQNGCITFVNTSTGTIDSIRWFINGITLSYPHSDTINVCFPLAGTDTVVLFAYGIGGANTSSKVIRIKATPHPKLTFDTMDCILWVPNVYLSYQWYTSVGELVTWSTTYSLIASMDAFFVVVAEEAILSL